MTRDELSVLARKLSLAGHSRLSKAELVERICGEDATRLNRILSPSWWTKHHNHVYGVVGVAGLVLSVAFFLWPNEQPLTVDSTVSPSARIINSSETPISFANFAALIPSERTNILDRYRGKDVVWEGYLLEPIGFELGSLEGVPTESEVGMRITPTAGSHKQISAECQFGILGGGDAGLENAMRLHLLFSGQRVRVSGKLGGDCDNPVVADAFLEAEWPLGE